MKIGDVLLASGLLDRNQLEEALQIQERSGDKLGTILIALGYVRRLDLYRTLAAQLHIPFVDLSQEDPDPEVLRLMEESFYRERWVFPVRREGECLVVAMVDPLDDETVKEVERCTGLQVKKVVTTDLDILRACQRSFGETLTRKAVTDLYRQDWDNSALETFQLPQLLSFLLIGTVVLVSLYFHFVSTVIVLNTVVQLLLFSTVAFKLLMTILGSRCEIEETVTAEDLEALQESALPVYTVLVPLYREAAVLPQISRSLRELDYPRSKLDIKLLLEENDTETIRMAKELALEGNFTLLIIPDSNPKTKPKALNYGFLFAKGELLTIYDAEDIPERDQLKKVVALFRKAPPEVICIQARLNYFNRHENLLTKLFTLEYSHWFDYLLPGLDRLGLPIPLGGTSNHFRTDPLRELLAWDPFNVTEDADLGIRAAAKGYRVKTVNATTFEEANKAVPSWIRQRSRWIKGYLQTYLVHMRHPVRFLRSCGLRSFITLNLFVGGPPITFLLTPLLWLVFIAWMVTRTEVFEAVFPPSILYLSLFNLLFGNFFGIFVSLLAGFYRRYYELVPYGLLFPFYTFLHSVAAYRAFWQLMKAPFYWEKTDHGLTRYSPLR